MFLADSSVPTNDCNITYTPTPQTIDTDTLDPQISNLENGKINTQPITSNLNEFTTNIGYFINSLQSNFTINDNNNV